ncbi:MAG: C1 family peptidase [Oscillospiraceae bacterium]|nr:C1 family peptidase [Oscillospiraceae bacterium]
MSKTITEQNIQDFDARFHQERVNQVAMNAVTSGGIQTAARRWESKAAERHQYSIRLDNRGITAQKMSGRCWMFAATNCLRYKVIHDLNLENFELSQNYTFFYDKLERANYFLESILETAERPTDDRTVAFLLTGPAQDGGQWDMISNIFQKYGVVPKDAMPESACSSAAREMNGMLNEKLREDACILRRGFQAGKSLEVLEEEKSAMVEDIYRMLCICLGTPPKTVDFQVRTRDGKYISDCGLTPKEFYDKYVGLDLSQYVSLINAPTADKPYMRSYTVKFLGNVVDGRPVRYVNLPIEELKKAAIAQMQDGEPVWFGCDVGKYSNRADGVMDLNAYDYEGLFGIKLGMTKADRLEYGHSAMTHAMVFQGVDLDENGKPLRWCVENSWGEEPGKKGMYLMTDEWFDQYMYQVVVNRKYLPQEVLDAYDSEMIELAPWDPMGALA